jgi:TonB family protein
VAGASDGCHEGFEGLTQVFDQQQIFVPSNPVPRRPIALLSVFAHCGLLALMVALAHAPRPRVVEQSYIVTSVAAGATRVAFNPPAAKGSPRRLSLPRRTRREAPMPPVPEVGATEGTASETLQRHAREATAAIVVDLKQRQYFGFSPGSYEIPVWLAGNLPTISPDEVPPRFEQLVTVEITIDVDGTVAQAKVVSGSVAPTIQHKLLSAILGFKYNPAKRGGTPIPSQLDLVIHIPS